MILTNDRASYISVFKAEFKPTLSVEHIGRIEQLPDGQWSIRFIGRNIIELSDLLNGSEKRQVIGTLDKLNEFGPRRQSDMRRRWNHITGLSVWADSVAADLQEISDDQHKKMLRL